ncbi:MAG: elongation factor P [Candidatus Woykebacteria bacterium RIFCSPHIGHO2_12_FULL_43_10]|uniref:Elongation factor P n=1 Tax=Candidatus Woykebacteria bacterium RIFCSPLOWO2_01_FULL_43_14 TaxID=1802605 RepID=A0A1G1WW93_9BACT|nr:MAG: elongation factor P [Candidatus Woykebacteria bacterium RIFCSPHIGHO2_01_FULL_43_29]OGY29180.1 MAG: elongation factor P [Candidatus Woykebacteria bacterium RIFCSPHIGHO2_12_FULL_43_10]OGY32018.1 MAG: elongation factor P [Candidatus Woykebacteria bacterium RIFCSPLOWO2_01_FULL_43_14]
MISVTDLRNGTMFQEDESPWIVLNYEFVKVGRGSANVKLKARNLKTGAIIEKSYISNARVEEANVEKKKVSYLYADGENFTFMDVGTYEQFSLPKNQLGGVDKFLKEGMVVSLITWDEQPLSVDLPNSIEFKVTETGPGERGNSVSNVLKPATLENGLVISVPLFIHEGDVIKVDTRQGSYIERVAR